MLDEHNGRVFKVADAGKRPYEYDDGVHISIVIEMDLDLKHIDRQVYNILDWIGDIGGLGEGCFFISFTLLGIIHYGALDNMVIRELFRVKKNQQGSSEPVNRARTRVAPAPNTTEHESPEQPVEPKESIMASLIPKTSSIRQLLQYSLPSKFICLCMKMNRRERLMSRCRAQYIKEIDIVEHIMQFREVRAQLISGSQVGMQKSSFLKRARTKVMSEGSLDQESVKSS